MIFNHQIPNKLRVIYLNYCFIFSTARPQMDILCLYVRCDDTHATVIVKFTQPIQVRKKTNLLLNLLLELNSPDKFSKPSNLSVWIYTSWPKFRAF